MELLAGILPWLQAVLAVLLIVAILLQRSNEDLGSAFGGSGGGVFYAKRGLEKQLFIATIVLAVLFLATSALSVFT
jgi:protein translocase SecG subunit